MKHDAENREREERHNREIKQKISEKEQLEKDLKQKMEKLIQRFMIEYLFVLGENQIQKK